MIRLYNYFRSSTSYRVRIALELKGMAYESVPVNLLKGEQRSEEYLQINPLGGVPALQDGDFVVSQSLAIIDYLDRLQPDPPLLPDDLKKQAFAWQIALAVAEDIHPLINLKTQKYLAEHFGVDEAGKKQWYAHWTHEGMKAIEAMVARSGLAGNFVLGENASIADICLIPHMYSMRRFGMDLGAYPLCERIERHCIGLPAFQRAAPETQAGIPDDLAPIHGPQSPLL